MNQHLVRAALIAALFSSAAVAENAGPALAFDLRTAFTATSFTTTGDGTTDPVTDSLTANDYTGTALSYTRDGGLLGGTVTLGVADGVNEQTLQGYGFAAIEFDEFFVWIKPFGDWLKITAGIFDNHDGINSYLTGERGMSKSTEYKMGVWTYDEDSHSIYLPQSGLGTSTALSNGIMAEVPLGPFTAALLFGPNLDASTFSPALDTDDPRAYSYAARLSGTLGGADIAFLYKRVQQPYNFVSYVSTVGQNTFGVYTDLHLVRHLGLTLGYTGYLRTVNATGIDDNGIWNGIDLRAQWTGFDRLLLTTHHNLSFARGNVHDGFAPWDIDFFNLYDILQADYELRGDLHLIATVSNILNQITRSADQDDTRFDRLTVTAECKKLVGEGSFVTAGLAFRSTTSGPLDSSGAPLENGTTTATVISSPVGLHVVW